MLERPAITDSEISNCLRDEYGIDAAEISFLPLGADRNTAVFQAIAGDGTPYFVKLRSGVFGEITILVPKLLRDQGVQSVIAPLSTVSQQLWAALGDFKVMVFPFIVGKDGSEVDLTELHWIALGQALKALHTANLPEAQLIQQEQYSDHWRIRVREFQKMAAEKPFADPIAAAMAAFLQQNKAVVDDLIQRAERLADALKTQKEPFVLCHADIHAWNVLIDAADHLYIVDWDTLILAPKERDLMFIGGGLFLNKRSPAEEQRLFYQGYGETLINPLALAYYRYERIVQDIAAYCEEILLTEGDSADRANGLRLLTGQFQPGSVISMAYQSDQNGAEFYRQDARSADI